MKKRSMKNLIIIIFVCIVFLILIGVITLCLFGGILSKTKYLEAWNKDYYKQFDDPRVQLISHGLLAANGHNMQPWKIVLDKNDNNIFYLYMDSERLTKEVDPYARQTMITQGTFLEYVRVASEKIGYNTKFEFFPYGEYDESNLEESIKDKPVAKIILNKNEVKTNILYDYMFLPDTNRGSYKKDQLSSEQVNKLQNISLDEDVIIKIFQSEDDLKKLGDYTIKGAEIETSVHRINEESAKIFRNNEYEKNKYRYGFSLEGQGTSGIIKYIMQGIITVFPSFNNEETTSKLYVESTKMAVDNTPCYAMIITKNNSRLNQIRAGILYSRLILTAHSLGLVMQPPSQVLEEYPEMQEQYNSIHNEYAISGETIQMLFRVGKPTKYFPKSMRRSVEELIVQN